jgi:glutaminase
MPSARVASPVEAFLRSLHERFRSLESGTVATYIPELARADPGWFGISVATADGHVYEVGDTRQPFTIQSISKPFVYGLALEDRGKAAVLASIGVEPTGDAFNEISLESSTGRPRNPMINAGAITATSLILGSSLEDRWQRLLTLFSLYAGRSLAQSDVVYRSERDTGHRNRAISHMLRNFSIIERDPEPDLDLYFRQCSIEVDCRDLSIMGATLATGGANPLTRERVLRPDNVDEVLSVMTTCGMYDYAGEWVYRVGLPAKSGVSGGIVAVMPGQLAVAVFSPKLDERGNSVRGVAVCEALSEELELHFLRAPRPAVSSLRSRLTARTFPSKRKRHDGERAVLSAIREHSGYLAFAGLKIQQQILSRGFDKATVETISPAMKATIQACCCPLSFNERVILPDQFVAPMWTHIVESPNVIFVVPHDQNGRVQNLQLARKIATYLGQTLNSANVQPVLFKNMLFLFFVEFGTDTVIQRNRAATKVWISISPSAGFWLLQARFLAHEIPYKCNLCDFCSSILAIEILRLTK